MSDGTTSNGTMRPLTVTEMRRIQHELSDLLPPVTAQWTLIAPDGRVWRGSVQQVFQALAPYHPILNRGGFL